MSKWVNRTINDFGKIVTGKTPPTLNKDLYGKGYKFVTPTDLDFNSYYIRNTERSVSEKSRKRYPNYFLPPESVSYTCIGATIGKSCLNKEYVLTNQQINSIIPNKLNDAKFIYYYLNAITPSIVAVAGGAATPIVNKKSFGSIKIRVPPLQTQQKIAKILSRYDDLIENNLKRTKLLKESLTLNYEELFLRFRIDGKKLDIDPKSGLPFGWKKVKINSLISYYIGGGWGDESVSDDFSDEAYVVRGTDIDDIVLGNLKSIPFRYHKSSNLSSRKLKNKDIIFEVSGGSKTEGVAKTLLITDSLLGQFNSDVICASFCKLVRPKEQYLGNMLDLSFKYLRRSKATEVFEIRSASNIINYNWEAFIKHQDLIMPKSDLLFDFDKKVNPLINEIYNLGHQNQLLKNVKEILLPRLMTGKIDTDDMVIAI